MKQRRKHSRRDEEEEAPVTEFGASSRSRYRAREALGIAPNGWRCAEIGLTLRGTKEEYLALQEVRVIP